MIRFLMPVLLMMSGQGVIAQGLVLENAVTGRTVTLSEGGDVELYLDHSASDITDCSSRYLKGTLVAPQKGLIRILPEAERKRYVFKNGLQKEDEVFYGNLSEGQQMNVKVADVNALTYRKAGAEDTNNLGMFITTISAFSALIAAPLVSIKYQEGGFNGDRYLRVAGYSLAATGIGVALMIGSKKRHYSVGQGGQAPDKKQWNIILK